MPLIPTELAPPAGRGGAPNFDWDLTITIDTSGDTPTYTAKGKHDGFPAYEFYINWKPIYQYTPGPGPYTFKDHIHKLYGALDVSFDVAAPLYP